MIITDFTILRNILKPQKIYNLYHFKPVGGFSIDSRTIKKGEAFIAIQGKYQDGHKFVGEAVKRGASFIVAQKNIPDKPRVPFFIVENTYDSLKSICSYIIRKEKPFIYAVTGSVGKTTTKDMLSFLLESKQSVLKNYGTENNFLGVCKTLISLKDEKIIVLELGTNAPGEIKTLAEIIFPRVGIITFIKPVHLEKLKSLKGIFEEKSSLLRVNPDICAVLNRDDPYLRKINFCKKIYWFGKRKDSHISARFIQRSNKESVFLVQDKFKLLLPVQFEGFIVNTLAALLAAHISGMKIKDLVERMNNFDNFSPTRMQIQKIKGLTIINDAYNANPYSFKCALEVVKRYPLKKIAVIGDMLELGDKSIYYHRLLAGDLLKGNFDYCLTYGEYTTHLKDRLNDLGYKKTFHFFCHKDIARFITRRADKDWLVFLKGSRAMKLEKVVELL